MLFFEAVRAAGWNYFAGGIASAIYKTVDGGYEAISEPYYKVAEGIEPEDVVAWMSKGDDDARKLDILPEHKRFIIGKETDKDGTWFVLRIHNNTIDRSFGVHYLRCLAYDEGAMDTDIWFPDGIE